MLRLPLAALLVGGAWTRVAEASPRGLTSRSVVVAPLLREPEKLRSWLLTRSPVLDAARARVASAQAEQQQSRLWDNPVLDAALGNLGLGMHTEPRGLTWQQTVTVDLGLSQTVELGKRGPRQRAATLRLRAARAQARDQLAERVFLARESMGALLYLTLRRHLLEESLEDAREVARLEAKRHEQQELSGVDYDRVLLEVAGLEQQVEALGSEVAAARASCDAFLLASCDLVGLDEHSLDTALPAAVPDGAEERRADVAALRLEAAAAREEQTLARRRAIPDVSLRVGYTHSHFQSSGDNPNVFSFGVAMPITLFDHGQAAAAQASARAAEAKASAEASLRGARVALSLARARLQAVRHNIQTIEQRSLPLAESVLTASETAFHRGGASLTDLLLARRAKLQLRLELLDSRHALFVLTNELRRAAGVDAVALDQEPS